MKFLDLFAGIGGFRLGMARAGHECVGFCEIDPFARKSYKAIHDTEGEFEFHDITRVTDESVRGIGRVDVICGGFPCQAFSIAGKRAGFEDTRGTLFFEIARFASILRPKYLFLENVTGLLNHDNGNTFETILGALDELGYDAEWQVFNSKNFGVPQNRERVFIIGHLRGAGGRAIFPFGGSDEEVSQSERHEITTSTLTTRYPESQGAGSYVVEGRKPKKIGNTNPSGRGMNGDVYASDGLAPTLTTNKGEGAKVIIADQLPGKFEMPNRVYDPEGIAPTIRTMQGGGLEPKIIQRGHGYNQGGEHDIAPTLTRNSWQENNHVKVYDFYNKTIKNEVGTLTANGGVSTTHCGTFGITDGFRIRKLTPRECWRLQGFPDWAFDRAQGVNSNSQLYKQAGNSVTVNVIEAIARRLE
ncbi:TPA: DNA cytosine methyltransferase [Streptococcus suis 11538]|uniref:DNA cytosine methyltransferase n=1 Tax=Streptococcus suis TaxID=1307 RepID=UPI0004A4BF8C|nr:DNA cytosine methyltransferase [Streptococcus suis]HEL2310501.1 DNA cytosine methyltransferase [Streptococcus suis]HEL2620143.1 DNA cytosine methyltransferase [Streptococcus suis]HEL2654314.1 DNA cytosine methyltransferase [Streptococcus suis]HEM2587610.1 DNA cytosine methyltransferase [Streptococcus suis]HEM2715316.1 DNA cytosine methyltransferase [Streptococcus suis]